MILTLVQAIVADDLKSVRRQLAKDPQLVLARVTAASEWFEENGADIAAVNRRGAQPLHYAADNLWSPEAQVVTIACLLNAGADPNEVLQRRSPTSAAPLRVSSRCKTPDGVDRGARTRRNSRS